MAQVLKPEVRTRIEAAALGCFARQGYPATTMAQIAAASRTAPANLYRYFPSKDALFDAVVPPDLPARHDALLDTRIAALAQGKTGPAGQELLDFWLDRRLSIVILLDRAQGTPHADYPAAFVRRLVEHCHRTVGRPIDPLHDEVLRLVFDNTRRALAHILERAQDRDEARELIAAFWSYQIPGLDGLLSHLGRSAARTT